MFTKYNSVNMAIRHKHAGGLTDVLIALTARELGATVVTANGGDFEAIRAVESFALERP
jgi:predicted nucleic acid-binding protein